jgi:hypothetical protein
MFSMHDISTWNIQIVNDKFWMISIIKLWDAKFLIFLMEKWANDHVLLTSCGCGFLSGPSAHNTLILTKKNPIDSKIHKGDEPYFARTINENHTKYA